MSPPSHAPAWRRVGLTLKRSSNHGDTSAIAASTLPAPKKRKLNTRQQLGPLPSANGTSKQHADASMPSTHAAATPPLRSEQNGPSATSEIVQAGPDTSPAPANVAKKRKSVTFSPDSKSEDGPSQVLAQTPLRPAPASDSTKKSNGKKRTDKAAGSESSHRNEPSDTADAQQPSDSQLKPYVQYLETYYNHKSNWKFNKNLQSQLLGSVYDTARIPEAFNDHLSSYLSGLRGASRRRLQDDAKVVLGQARPDRGADSSSDPQALQETQDVGTRQRANLILAALSQASDDPPPGRASAASTTTNGPVTASTTQPRPGKRSRGRKRRSIAGAADVSSSSSSSSNSSSDSDSDTESDNDNDTQSSSNSSRGSAMGSQADKLLQNSNTSSRAKAATLDASETSSDSSISDEDT